MAEEDDEEAFRKHQERLKQMTNGAAARQQSARPPVPTTPARPAPIESRRRGSTNVSTSSGDQEARNQQLEKLKASLSSNSVVTPVVVRKKSSIIKLSPSFGSSAASAQTASSAQTSEPQNQQQLHRDSEPDEAAVQRYFEKIMKERETGVVPVGGDEAPDEEAVQRHYERIMASGAAGSGSQDTPDDAEVERRFERIMKESREAANGSAPAPKEPTPPAPKPVNDVVPPPQPEPQSNGSSSSSVPKPMEQEITSPQVVEAPVLEQQGDVVPDGGPALEEEVWVEIAEPDLVLPIPLVILGSWASVPWSTLCALELSLIIILSFILPGITIFGVLVIFHIILRKGLDLVSPFFSKVGISNFERHRMEKGIGFFGLLSLSVRSIPVAMFVRRIKSLPGSDQAALGVLIMSLGLFVGFVPLYLTCLLFLLCFPLVYQMSFRDLDPFLELIMPEIFPFDQERANWIKERIDSFRGRLGLFYDL